MLRQPTGATTEALEALVGTESPSSDAAACRACARVLDDLAAESWGTRAELVERDGRPHLRWDFGGEPAVVLLGHLDTVWPVGTLARRPFAVDGDRVTGPGCFDMKAGLVQLLHAVAGLDDRTGVRVLVTSDEETGSASSRALIEETARGARAVLVLEPSADGALKTARKGVSMYELAITGLAAHAGLEPERGVNATVELAHQVRAIVDLARPAIGTTVTPTVASAGTTGNTVPAHASVHVDVRAAEPDEQDRVDAALRALRPVLPGARLQVGGGPNRPPMPSSSSADLFARAQRIATELELAPVHGVAVGGGSDGNFTAGIGVPTLDGLGAVGGGAHAEDEWASLSAVAERAALVSALVDDLLRDRR